jgi:cobalt-zinc-cadmium efflux system outer membrane protein
MSYVPIARLTVAVLALHSFPAAAEHVELDLRGAIERAHRVAPEAVAARGQIASAEAGVRGADVVFTTNPEIEGGAGPRFTPSRPIDGELRLEQDLEPWRRAPRRQLAGAELRQASAAVDNALRELDLEVSIAFYEALFADHAAELARHTQDLAQRAAAIAGRRRQAGEITDLEANLVRAASGRATSAVLAAASDRSLAIGRLAARIGLAPGDDLMLRGDLASAAAPEPSVVRGSLAARADVRVLDTEREIANAQEAQATASGRPEIAVWAAYQREDTAAVVLGGLRMSLPLWNRAQGARAAAVARRRRAVETRDATLRAADRQVADASAAYTSAKQAVEAFEREVVPLLDDSERLLQNTVDAGQIAVNDYLVARQELLGGRREHLERLLALAKAFAGVRFASGVAP